MKSILGRSQGAAGAASVLTFLFTLLSLESAAAFTDEWQWKVSGYSPTFQTKAEAIAYMHSLGGADALRTIESSMRPVSGDYEWYVYTAPMKAK